MSTPITVAKQDILVYFESRVYLNGGGGVSDWASELQSTL